MIFDAIIIGGGHTGMERATRLQESGLRCAVISKGRSIYGLENKRFEDLGGILLMDDTVCGAEFEGDRLISVRTTKLGNVSLQAREFHLATGRFLSGGLVADMDKVYEPVFGLDVDYLADRSQWFGRKFADPQPFLAFGVKVDSEGHAIKEGRAIVNLFPVGDIISKM